MLDTTGTDIGPLLADAASRHGIPDILVLTCAKAESGLNPEAARYGVWPDVSFGLFQQTVAYAPIGDGSQSPANIELVKTALFDRATSISIGCSHLAGNFRDATARYPDASEDDTILLALSAYNAGSVQTPGNWWWQSGNCATYRAALDWARGILGLLK